MTVSVKNFFEKVKYTCLQSFSTDVPSLSFHDCYLNWPFISNIPGFLVSLSPSIGCFKSPRMFNSSGLESRFVSVFNLICTSSNCSSNLTICGK